MSPLIKFALRFLVISAALVALVQVAGQAAVEKLSPLYAWQIAQWDDHFEVADLSVQREGVETVLQLTVKLARPIFIGGEYRLPDERGLAHASIVLSQVWVLSIVLWAGLLAWQFTAWSSRWLSYLVAVPVWCLLMSVDVPLALLGSLWHLIYQAMHMPAEGVLVFWGSFLIGGGRLALGLVGAVLVIAITEKIQTRLLKQR